MEKILLTGFTGSTGFDINPQEKNFLNNQLMRMHIQPEKKPWEKET
ncbi:MAG: hypothetical protein JRJ85_00795 [Deltaproteobacteria bacterium]|nr:hypothetical protein [Deltaproteobacteria bacterium]